MSAKLTVERVMENGKRYKAELLANESSPFQKAREDWLIALEFFLSRALSQGIAAAFSGSLLIELMDLIKLTISELGSSPSLKELRDAIKPKLEGRVGRKFGRRREIELLTTTLSFIEEYAPEDWNILEYSIQLMRAGLTDCLYYRLTREIAGLGPMTSSLFLRDTYFLAEEELRSSFKKPRDFRFLLPIDAWVRRVVSCLGFFNYPLERIAFGDPELDRKLREAMANEFAELSPIFNAGAWYTGFHELREGLYPECRRFRAKVGRLVRREIVSRIDEWLS